MEAISNFIQENPRYLAVILIIGGIGLFIYLIKTHSKEKILRNTINKYYNKNFDYYLEKAESTMTKIVYFTVSIILILSGIWLIFFEK